MGDHMSDILEMKKYAKMYNDKGSVLTLSYQNQIYKFSVLYGSIHGPFKKIDNFGNVCLICNFFWGELDGEYLEFENKNLKISCFYKGGLLNGNYKLYDSENDVIFACEYKNDKKNGTQIKYRKNGDIKEYCTFKDDKIHGNKMDSYDDGTVEIKKYDNGKVIKN